MSGRRRMDLYHMKCTYSSVFFVILYLFDFRGTPFFDSCQVDIPFLASTSNPSKPSLFSHFDKTYVLHVAMPTSRHSVERMERMNGENVVSILF